MRSTACGKICVDSSTVSNEPSAPERKDQDEMANGVANAPGTTPESFYVVPGEITPAALTKNLQALLPTRPHPIARHRFTVLDTFDGRVCRSGARLTREDVDDAALVAWQPRGGGRQLTLRLDEPVGFAWDLPRSPLQQAVAPIIGVRRLLAQADAEAYGTELDILDDRHKTVARLRIESGHVRPPMSRRAWQPLPTTVTFMGLRGYEETYQRLLPVIESRPGVTLCPEGLQRVMLRQVGVPDRGDLSKLAIDIAPTVRADEGARLIHRRLLDTMVAHEPGLRANLDTEFLHDFRVALRRMRSLLGQIRQVFAPEVVEHFSTEFSWIGRLTGPARDIDVLVLALQSPRRDMPDDDMAGVMEFLHHLQQQEHQKLVEALNSDRYRRLLSDWETFLERRDPLMPLAVNANRSLTEVITERAWRLTRRIASCAETIDPHTDAQQIHEVRIAAKKLRYLVDVAPSFCDEGDLASIVGVLKKLQRALGDFNDARVQAARLLDYGRALGAAGGPPGALLALGRLAEQSHQRGERLREEVIDKLALFGRRDTRSVCRRAFRATPQAPEAAR
jgi:CHAD domain-containing protein